MASRGVEPWETQQGVARLLGPALALPLLAGLVAYGLTVVPAGPAQGWLRTGVVVLGLAAAVVLVAAPVARWASCRLVVTATHVAVRGGTVRQRERAVPLARVAEVRTVQTVLGRLLGHGTLLVLPEHGPLLRCDHVPAVRAAQAVVLERAEAAGAGRHGHEDGADGADGADDEDGAQARPVDSHEGDPRA